MAYPAVLSHVFARRVFGRFTSSSFASYLRRALKMRETSIEHFIAAKPGNVPHFFPDSICTR